MSGGLDIAVVGAIFAASLTAVIGLGLFVISVVLKAQRKYRKRLSRVSRSRMAGRIDIDEARLNLAKKKVEAGVLVTLTELLSKFVPLLDTARLKKNFVRAGMKMTVGSFVLTSVLVATVLAVAGILLIEVPPPVIVIGSLILGMLAVDLFVKFRGDRNSSKFMAQLPDGLDTIIRGIKSGLPVVECIGAVGKEFDDPIGGHFRAVNERVQLGESLDSSLWGVARIVNRPELDFLAVCISIQMETGGSLAEALSNLADLLRKRQQMKLKIRAISSEAKASALIIGSLPFAMLALLSFLSPDYVAPLFTDPRGQMMLMVGGSSITIGAFIMWRMTQFEI